jgi:uncharacterized RDD family membrane protein YckC
MENDVSAMTDSPNETQKATQGPHNSTLIEFPGVNRNRPAWRKELSEKVREIQQRRAREAALEAGAVTAPARRQPATPKASAAVAQATEPPSAQTAEAPVAATGEEAAKQLGLVPPPETPELNPLVVAALRRIERARTRAQHAPRSAHGRGQAAAARVLEEQFEQEDEQAQHSGQLMRPAAAPRPEKPETAHASNLVVVAAPKPETRSTETKQRTQAAPAAGQPTPASAPQAAPRVEPAPPASPPATGTKVANNATNAAARVAVKPEARTSQSTASTPEIVAAAAVSVEAPGAELKPQPRKLAGVLDDHWLERHGADPLPKVETAAYDDRAPIGGRIAAALFDLLAVAFLCAPFAAVIELTIGEWRDPRVLGSIGGIVAVVLFLYHTCAVALAGRTWGMRLLSLHAVDADSARVPTTWQCAVRALVYMLSLATFGLGIIYAILDAEGRTAHDLLSRTVVVKE